MKQLLAALCLSLLCQLAWAERYALLVGVSNYPGLDKKFSLEGPANDIPLMRGLLEKRGFSPTNVQTLADGVSGAGEPTRAAILTALDGLAANSKAGDFVFLYLAGHGSQQPVDAKDPKAKSEPDGLYEIFLPRDAGPWNDKAAVVQNAILDHEFIARLDTMLAKGVFVWAVFDACHSATLMRSVPGDGVKARQLSPRDLGVPQAALDAAAANAPKPEVLARGAPQEVLPAQPRKLSGEQKQGGYVAFYAAQTTEPTFEERLPAGHPERKPYGIFGFALAEALASSEGASYRQLAQQVLYRYASQNRSNPTPLFTGTHLDSTVFGSAPAPAIRQWPLREEPGVLSIEAGALQQLQEGERLAVVASPLAADDAVLGYAQLDRVRVLEARATLVAHDGKPLLDRAKLPRGAYLRQLKPSVNFRLAVARPVAESAASKAALDAFAKDASGVHISFVASGASPDLRLVEEDGKLWFLSPSGALVKTGASKSLSLEITHAEFAPGLADTLRRVAKALNLVRLSGQIEAAAAAKNLEATVSFKRKDGGTIVASALPTLADGDVVELTMKNKGRSAVDVTALYIDGEYGIGVLYPPQPGASNRIEAGASDVIKIDIHDDTTGIERLLLVAVEARAGQDRADFSFLSQARIERTREVRGSDEVRELFAEAGFGGAGLTRSAKPQLPGRTEMRLLQWRVVGK